MKKKVSLIALLVLTFGITCLAQKSSGKNVDLTLIQARPLEPDPAMLVTPLIADIEVAKGTISVFVKDYYFNSNMPEHMIVRTLNDLKMKALFEFSDSENADLIVAPLFSITTEMDVNTGENIVKNGSLIKVNVKVKGFPAKYVNMRLAKESDLWVQNVAETNKKGALNPEETSVSLERSKLLNLIK